MTTSPRRPDGAWRWSGLALVATGGLILSAYLLLHRWGIVGSLTCSVIDGCTIVQTSEYAVFLGVPVAAWGLLWYLAVLALCLLLALRASPTVRLRRWLAYLATGGLLFSAYLTAIELWVLRAFCQWRVVSALLTAAIFGLAQPWRFLIRDRRGRS